MKDSRLETDILFSGLFAIAGRDQESLDIVAGALTAFTALMISQGALDKEASLAEMVKDIRAKMVGDAPRPYGATLQ